MSERLFGCFLCFLSNFSGGFRDNALFPCGMVRDDEGKIRIYYSAGDAVVRMAYADEKDLIALCSEARNAESPLCRRLRKRV